MADEPVIIPRRPPGPHPTPEQLYRARRGPRTSEAERWLAHAAACAACTEELLRLEAFDEPDAVSPGRLADAWGRFGKQAARPPIAPASPLPPPAPLASITPIHQNAIPAAIISGRKATPSRVPWFAALAAGIAAVAGLSVWTSTHPSQLPAASPPAVRGGHGGTAATGSWIPTGLLDAPPSQIVFPRANGDAQQVTMFDADHTYTWTSPPTFEGRVLFPVNERLRLRKGVDYYWTLIGQDDMEAKSFRLR